jgi:low temperature requirement protein LtrA
MIAQLILSALLAAILLYAWTEYRRSPAVAFLTVAIATSGLYFVKTRGASRDRPRGRPHSLRLGLQGTQAEP